MTIYMVYIIDANGIALHSATAHRTHKGALAQWNKERRRLIRQCWKFGRGASPHIKKMYADMRYELACTDPEKIACYPHETPRIQEFAVKP